MFINETLLPVADSESDILVRARSYSPVAKAQLSDRNAKSQDVVYLRNRRIRDSDGNTSAERGFDAETIVRQIQCPSCGDIQMV